MVFGREPALWLGVLSAGLSVAVTLGVGLTTVQAGAIVAAVSAVGGAVTAAVTRPVAPAAFTGAIGALVALVAAFGLEVSPELVAAMSGMTVAVLALLTRGQVSPAPAVAGEEQGAPSGPRAV
ncbi:hypothetical protein FOE67_20440 [Streptomyces calidiresistens]|uniref:Uncharacterized protein n=1 Tax=Streptomyces calidiresistens TaxID=1485586 RepID=A0A7W3T6F1_9ACTN|nr:hypothetical protein [Streptomyces calidiresistens]